MKGKVISLTWLLLVVLVVAVAPVAAAEGESVFLPGWVAWLMVVVALAVPAALYFYLRSNGRL